MLKRVLLIGFAVSLGLTALHGGAAEAQTWSYIEPPGTWYYFGSVEPCALIGSVPNPTTHPARLACSVNVTQVESLCNNPNNHSVAPGAAATQVIFSSAQGITPNDLLSKTKGTAALCLEVNGTDADCTLNPTDPLCNNNFCVNPNWNIVRVMTTEFQANCQTQACASGIVDSAGNCCTSTGVNTDPVTGITTCKSVGTWVTKDTQVCDCTLPPPFSISNPPPHCGQITDPLNPPADCVAYQCFNVATGAACSLH